MMPPENSTSDYNVEISESEPNPDQSTSQDEPADTTATTTVTRSPLAIHTVWFKSPPGQLMCVQLMFSLLAFICIVAGYHGSHSYWFFALVAFFSFLWAVSVVLVHLFQLYRRFAEIPWMPIELITTVVFVLMWFIADIVLLSRLYFANSGAALMCGIFAFLTYCLCVYLGAMGYLDQVRRQGTPMPSATKAADRAEGGGGDSDSNSEDSLSELPTVNPIGP